MYTVVCQMHGEIGTYTSKSKAIRSADLHKLLPGHYGKWVKVIQTLLSTQKEINNKSIKFKQEFIVYTVIGNKKGKN